MDIYEHLDENHSVNYYFDYTKDFILCYELENLKNWGNPVPIYAYDNTFYQVAYYDSEFRHLNLWLYLLGDYKEAEKYSFSYRISVKNEEFEHFGHVQSLEENYEEIIFKRNAFQFGLPFFERILKNNSNIELVLNIFKD